MVEVFWACYYQIRTRIQGVAKALFFKFLPIFLEHPVTISNGRNQYQEPITYEGTKFSQIITGFNLGENEGSLQIHTWLEYFSMHFEHTRAATLKKYIKIHFA